MDKIRDEFIAELFDMMRNEIKGLNYDTRMTDLWRASITENVVAAIHYLDRDEPTALLEAPAAALAYARAAARAIFRWRRWFGRIGSGMRASSRWRCNTSRRWSRLSKYRRSSSWLLAGPAWLTWWPTR